MVRSGYFVSLSRAIGSRPELECLENDLGNKASSQRAGRGHQIDVYGVVVGCVHSVADPCKPALLAATYDKRDVNTKMRL